MREEYAPQQLRDLVRKWHQNYRALYDNAHQILEHLDDLEAQEAYTIEQRRYLKQEYSRALAVPIPSFEELVAIYQSDRMADYHHPLEYIRLPRS